MKKYILSLLLVTSVWHETMAEVQAVTILTGRGEGAPTGAPSSYFVPTGKVLILESVQYYPPLGQEPTDLIVQVNQTALNYGSLRFTFISVGPFERYKLYPFDKPIRLNAGEAVDSNSIRGYYLWRGLLVDTTDLFAKLNLELDNPRVEGSKFLADTTVSPPRQHKLTVESSLDLQSFTEDPSVVVASGSTAAQKTVSVDLDPSGKKFLRAAAIARPNP